MANLEHLAFRQLTELHPRKGGIFSYSHEERLQLTSMMDWLKVNFGEPSLHELRTKLNKGLLSDQLKEQAVKKWVNGHGLEYDSKVVKEAFETAEGVHDYFAKRLFPNNLVIASKNEVEHERNPITLLNFALNNPDPRLSFEAARKLYLADMALAAQNAREEEDTKMKKLYLLLNEGMFTPPGKIGEKDEEPHFPGKLTDNHYISYHSLDDFHCRYIRQVNDKEKIDESMLTPDMRLHTIPMRTWYDLKGKPHYVLIEPRVKDQVSFLVKMLRNDTANPHSLDDTLGVKLTFASRREVDLFRRTLQARQTIPSSPFLMDVSDTLNRENGSISNLHKRKHKASSPNLEIMKFHITIGGKLYELQCNTIRTYIDTKYRDGVCWEDYELNRVILPDKEKGLAIIDLLYPKAIYNTDLRLEAKGKLSTNRQKRRSEYSNIPEELRRKGRVVYSMTPSELESGIFNLAIQMRNSNYVPDYIIIAEEDHKRLFPVALGLANFLDVPNNHIIPRNEVNRIPNNANVLIFDDIFRFAKNIKQTRKKLAENHKKYKINVATLIADTKVPKKRLKGVFFAQRINTQTIRILFPFEAKFGIDNSSVVYIIRRKRVEKGEKVNERVEKRKIVTEILVEIEPDGKYKIPGGSIQKTKSPRNQIDENESPHHAVIREINEELGIHIKNNNVSSITDKKGNPFLTTFEPHPDLTKPHFYNIKHHVYLIHAPDIQHGKKDLPNKFKWVSVVGLKQQLRWVGQKELWSQLKPILRKIKY